MAAENDTKTEPAPASGPGMMGKIVMGMVVSIVVLIESVVAYMMLPNPEAIASKVREEVKNEIDQGKDDKEDIVADSEVEAECTEVELGSFSLGVHQPNSNTTLNITCKVMGTIAKSDKAEFDTLLANNSNRLRERIIIEFRTANVTELTAANLGLIKQRIKEKSNTLLGKPIIKSIMFPDYNYYQQ